MLASERQAEHAHEYHYDRHRPEETVLYGVVSEHWSSFRERIEGLGSLPKFVVNEVDEYLRCGLLEHGFIRYSVRIADSSDLLRLAASAEVFARRVWAGG